MSDLNKKTLDLDKIKEALARRAERRAGIEGPARYADCRPDDEAASEDRALLLDVVPDLVAEIEERGAEIVKARNERDAALAEIERLKADRAKIGATATTSDSWPRIVFVPDFGYDCDEENAGRDWSARQIHATRRGKAEAHLRAAEFRAAGGDATVIRLRPRVVRDSAK